MLKSDLLVVASNSHPIRSEESDSEVFEVEEILTEDRLGVPDFKFFSAQTEQELDSKVRTWRDTEMVGNTLYADVKVMSPTVSDDGVWHVAVNFLKFEEDVDPWS